MKCPKTTKSRCTKSTCAILDCNTKKAVPAVYISCLRRTTTRTSQENVRANHRHRTSRIGGVGKRLEQTGERKSGTKSWPALLMQQTSDETLPPMSPSPCRFGIWSIKIPTQETALPADTWIQHKANLAKIKEPLVWDT